MGRAYKYAKILVKNPETGIQEKLQVNNHMKIKGKHVIVVLDVRPRFFYEKGFLRYTYEEVLDQEEYLKYLKALQDLYGLLG